MSPLTIDSTIKLSSGNLMPRLALGVYQSRGAECQNAVSEALKVGYRYIDTAQGYHNEDLVGRGMVESGVSRSKIFVTTKYMPSHTVHSSASVLEVLRKSLKPLSKGFAKDQQPYIDVMLIHAPWGGAKGRAENWKALVAAQKEGWIKDIGVSNFGVKHLEELPQPVPAVNQIELHPWCQQREIVSYCEKNGIALQAYCPIVRGDKKRLSEPKLVKISEKHGKEPAQVLIRWGLQKGYSVLPKSVTPSRIKSNSEVYDFELDSSDMEALDSLDMGASGACSWNPVDAD
ncbi:Uncharacterized oxidoreductase [Saitozyma sp. JCM 24511]|nr:Uncharacterized oxidoreductase [Saitozyma sp. JCM 24511]